MSSLLQAITLRRWRQARLLLEVGADVNRKGEEGRTALMELCFVENEGHASALTKLLIENGANVGIKDKDGKTALIYACILRKKKLIDLMTMYIDYDLNSVDFDGNTALNYAIINDEEDVVTGLVRKIKSFGLSVDTYNAKGETVLINALKARKMEIADILVDEGKASLQILDKESGKTAFELRRDILQSRKRKPYHIPSALLRETGSIRSRNKTTGEQGKKIKSAVVRKFFLPQVENPYSRPVTAPDRIFVSEFYLPSTPINEELGKLFIMYNQQTSELYRKGYKPVKYVPKPTVVEVDSCSDAGSQDDETMSQGKGKVSFSQMNELSAKLKGLYKASSNKRKVVNLLTTQGLMRSDTQESLKSEGKTSKMVSKMVKSPALKAFASATKPIPVSTNKLANISKMLGKNEQH